jgi:Ca2+-transporting ATPase
MARQPDHVQPKEAEVLYKEYLIKQLGDAKNVWFKEHCEEEEMRCRYDPVRIEESLKGREAEAKESVSEFINPNEDGKPQVDSTKPEEMEVGNQSSPSSASTVVGKIPDMAWQPERLRKDAVVLHKLITKLDQEKNIQKNPLFGDPEKWQLKDEDKVGMFGKMQQYVWKVHGVDYYQGKELSFADFKARHETAYWRKGPNPYENGTTTTTTTEEGGKDKDAAAMETEDQSSDKDKKKSDQVGAFEGTSTEAQEFFNKLEIQWELRILEGDQAFKLLGKARIEQDSNGFVRDNVQTIDGNKFMCKLCTKLFKGKDFVEKHIKVKHAEIVEQFKAEIVQKIYADNFLNDKTFTKHEKEYQDLMNMKNQAATVPIMGADGQQMGHFIPLHMADAANNRQTPKKGSYTDLDRPKQAETRTVLDYGDI